MTRHHVMIAVALIALAGLAAGCGDSTTAPTEVTEAPVLAPAGVSTTVTSSGHVEVTWLANTQTNISGYNVYRYDRRSQSLVQLNSSLINGNRYIDSTTRHTSLFQYRVTAVSSRNVESNYSSSWVDYRAADKHIDKHFKGQ